MGSRKAHLLQMYRGAINGSMSDKDSSWPQPAKPGVVQVQI